MIRVRIEELVLHGFDPRDRRAIAEAVREELGRLLGAQTGVSVPHVAQTLLSAHAIDAGEVPIDSIRSRTTGASVAAAVHRGITGGGEKQ